jgi:integrase
MASMSKIHITAYVLNGKRVAKGTPGAVKTRSKSSKYYGFNVPGYPPKKRVPLKVNKKAAQRLLEDLCRAGEMGEVGLVDRSGHNKRSLAAHIKEFRLSLVAADNTADYVRIATNRIKEVAKGCKFESLSDLCGLKAANYLSDCRTTIMRRGNHTKTMSITTSNLYMDALTQFGRWLEDEKRIHRNPFERMVRGNKDTDPRRARRAIKPDDFQKLLEAARRSPRTVYNLSGEDRYWLYRTAYYTAFRIAALCSLTRESFDLAGDIPTVTLATVKNKSRKLKTNAIPKDFAKQLGKYLARFALGEPIWGRGCAVDHGADMVRADLEVAKLPFEVSGPDGPLRFDFHALRHTAITELSRDDLRTAQEIAGHTKPTITAKYAHRDLSDQLDAVKRMRG